MSKRLTELSFIIGLFFTLVSLILLIGYFTTTTLAARINMYAGFGFLAFGLFMMSLTSTTKQKSPPNRH